MKRVDLETYGLFKAIMLKEGKEWESAVASASREDQAAIQDLGKQFFEVRRISLLANCRHSVIMKYLRKK